MMKNLEMKNHVARGRLPDPGSLEYPGIIWSYGWHGPRDPSADATPAAGGAVNDFGAALASEIRGAKDMSDSMQVPIHVYSTGERARDIHVTSKEVPDDSVHHVTLSPTDHMDTCHNCGLRKEIRLWLDDKPTCSICESILVKPATTWEDVAEAWDKVAKAWDKVPGALVDGAAMGAAAGLILSLAAVFVFVLYKIY